MSNYIDLTKISKKYKGSWIALDSRLTTVVSNDKNAKKAFDKAIEKGYKKPTLFKVPKEIIPYFGFIIYGKVQM